MKLENAAATNHHRYFRRAFLGPGLASQEIEKGLRGAERWTTSRHHCTDVSPYRRGDRNTGYVVGHWPDGHRWQKGQAGAATHHFDEVLHARDFADDSPGESGARTRCVDLRTEGRISAVLNEISVAEHGVAEADGATTRQRVVAAHREDERIVTEIRCHQPGPVDWPVDEGDVELAVDNCPREVAGSTPGQTKSDCRMVRSERRKEGGQVHDAKRLNCPHVQLAA